MSRLTYHKLRVARVVEETHDARTIEFEIPAELKAQFQFKPGQHLQLRVPCGDGGKTLPRCYSLSGTLAVSSDPTRVTVKRVSAATAPLLAL